MPHLLVWGLRCAGRATSALAVVAVALAVVGGVPVAAVSPASRPYPAWSRVPDQPALASSVMSGIAAGPNRFVAVGGTIRSDGQPEAAAWVSSTGTSWRRATRPPAGGSPARVIRDRLGYVAWGVRDGPTACAWVSADGSTWGPAAPLSGPQATVAGMARLGGSLVAVGSIQASAGGQLTTKARSWTSRDGRAWRVLTPVFSTRATVIFYGATAWRDSLVAWGVVIDPTAASPYDSERAATFRSTDGRHWTIGTLFPRSGYMRDIVDVVVAGGPRLVALGRLQVGDAGSPSAASAVWTSTDGLTWTRAAGQTPSPAYSLATWDGRRFIAVGWDASWTSLDGRRWTRVPSAPDAARDGSFGGCTGGPVCPRTGMSGIAAGSSGLVVVGTSRGEDGVTEHAVVWVAPAPGP